ncbi:11055_t:CDS:2 [Paraglomus occultum]|uniref:F-actin-capping protein subunit alpha n=1 Tax=Paraglomus occultum TaxID=144539 RepID=A0A9N9B2I9_9GLOM|nr:11055_t:CDS:2 [Paraglomus occultum]
MAFLNDEKKLEIITKFLLDSPPGEVNDVYNDLRSLMNNPVVFKEGVLTALEQYNTEQFVTVTPPGQEHNVIISKYGQIEPNIFVDPKSHQKFRFDHMQQVATDPEPYEPDEATEPLRAALETAVQNYITDHYPDGIATVYSTQDSTLTIAIVDNKYNPDNFWNGRWRSAWVITPTTGEIKGTVKVNVHYFEDGNVQLNTEKTHDGTVKIDAENPETAAAAIAKYIHKVEDDFQKSLNDAYIELNENTFKELRRALPLTRHKIDWDKIMNYKIGQELAGRE